MGGAIGGRCPGAVVDGVRLADAADGTNRRARLELTYSGGTGPASVFVKMQGRVLHRLALLALRAWQAEARLGGSGVDLPLEHPLVYGFGVDRARVASVVVMEDVAVRGGTPNDATRPLSAEQVESGLSGLAAMHARFWDCPLPDGLGFLRPWRLGAVWAPLSRASLARGIRRVRAAGTAGLLPRAASAAALERQFRRWATLADTGSRTVLHGDPHPGNTYTLPGGVTGFYDWQLVRTGNWSHDVGYFLVSSLDVETRRAEERRLLSGYLDALRDAGAPAPAFGEAFDLYRATPAFGLATWLHTFSAGSFQSDDICVSTLERFATAYDDLDTGRSVVAG